MPRKIQVLPEPIAQSIAAGEVVERPASVVKELIENAIDAGASEIVVELETAGLQRIRVYDNGAGIDPEDVPVALQRYATSKIKRLEDLFNIRTLGFRGEALPSIASVSQLTIKTRVPQALTGSRVVSEGGEIKSVSEIGCPIGTEVEVRNLFYNLPVKRKFLKSTRSELHQALNHFLRLSLSYPSITFKLIHDGRLLHELLKTDSVDVRIEAVLGSDLVQHLQRVSLEEGEIRVSGYGSLPSLLKGNAEGFYIYVNRRYARDRMIYKAIMEAYRHAVPTGKYPWVILWIEVPPYSVDVNVHPTKAEVRFRDPERVFQTALRALRALHEPESMIQEGHLDEGKTGIPLSQRPFFQPPSAPRGEAVVPMVRDRPGPEWEEMRKSGPRILGQAHGTYLVCEVEQGLMLVDQHAAHERILYEEYRKAYETGSLAVVKFLIPPLIELSAEESFLLSSSLEEFQALGFELDPVGERLYAIRSVPSLIEEKDAQQVIWEILDEMSLRKREGKGTETVDALLVALSCHAAVKGNLRMRQEEMDELVTRLSPFPQSTTCPHGRPLCFLLTWEELKREFRRSR